MSKGGILLRKASTNEEKWFDKTRFWLARAILWAGGSKIYVVANEGSVMEKVHARQLELIIEPMLRLP